VEISEDSWLSERFGHPVFTVRGPDGLAAHAATQERATYQARVAAGDVGGLAGLESAGMRVVNVTLTLTADPAVVPLGGSNGEVREADPERDQALLEVARRSFRYTRFHLDPDVPQDVADRIKHDWVWSYLNGRRGDELLVAIRNGEPVGFLCGMAGTGDARRLRVIDLIGVAPEEQGSGAGRALVSAFLERAAGRCDTVEVGTQLANTQATAFYERLGFVATRAAYDLHLHVG
jgi:ribosomal protein S18 acetylase RimI-like enzyme